MAIPDYLSTGALAKSPLAQIRSAISNFSCETRVAMPGIIQAFDPAEQTVSVRLALREKMIVQNAATNVQIPDLIHVPVVIPRAGGWALTLPIQAGDECLVVFGDMCMDSWWQSGGVQNQLKLRRHSLSDGFAIVGLWNQQRKISSYSTSSAQLRSEDGHTVIDLAPAGITITAAKLTVNTTGDVDVSASGTVNVTASTKVNISGGGHTSIEGKDWLTHSHSGVQSGGSDTGPVV